MFVEDKQTGEKYEATIRKVTIQEFAKIKKSNRFEFDWSRYRGQEVYKICIVGSDEILGLMRVIDHPDPGFDFLEIDVIETSKENRGKGNGLDRIAGCLLGYAVLLSDEYGHAGFIGLTAKTQKAKIFHRKYGFEHIGSIGVFGKRMASNTANSIRLVKEYVDKKL